jgi:DNA-binding GntR family transcriptional regulator
MLYDELRNAILYGDLAPGEPLRVAELAARYRVSRTPVREAIARLEQDGLVARTQAGVVVRVRSPEEVLELYDVRIMLEGAAAAAAARRHTAFDLATLVAAQDQFASCPPEEAPAHSRHFHELVWHAAHNLTLVDLLKRVDSYMARYSASTLSVPGRTEAAVAEHGAILEALVAGDAAAAERAALEHFRAARGVRLRMFAEAPRGENDAALVPRR